jgi:hypothetical protein
MICYFIRRCRRIEVGCMGCAFAVGISKGKMHLSISQRKTCWTTLEGIFVILANIARIRRDIVQMMC